MSGEMQYTASPHFVLSTGATSEVLKTSEVWIVETSLPVGCNSASSLDSIMLSDVQSNKGVGYDVLRSMYQLKK